MDVCLSTIYLSVSLDGVLDVVVECLHMFRGLLGEDKNRYSY